MRLNSEVQLFLMDLVNPSMYGHAVTAEIRDRARVLLGLAAVETKPSNHQRESLTEKKAYYDNSDSRSASINSKFPLLHLEPAASICVECNGCFHCRPRP